MDEQTRKMHLAAGEYYGRIPTCGNKVDYVTEETADRSALAMTAKRADGKVLEAYPCFWCSGWHIGRAMTDKEKESVMRDIRGLQP